MDFQLPDGRTLDDAEPQDVARLAGRVLATLAEEIANGGPEPHRRDELVTLLVQAAALMRAWAQFGRWEPMRVERARKVTARITDAHIAAAEPEVATILRRLRDLLPPSTAPEVPRGE